MTRSGTASAMNRRSRPSPARRRKSCRPKAFGRTSRIIVDWAMRYGLPPIAERLKALRSRAATASSSFRSIRNTAPRRRRPSPTRCSRPWRSCAGSRRLRIVPPYLRSARVYRCAGAAASTRPSEDAGLDARSHPCLFSRTAGKLCRGRRSLLLVIARKRPRAAARKTWSCRKEAQSGFPVALWPGRMAQALCAGHRWRGLPGKASTIS